MIEKKIIPNEFWLDGICKQCGCIVIERSSFFDLDYMNSCTNPKCENFGWHTYDSDSPEYYHHGFKPHNIPFKKSGDK